MTRAHSIHRSYADGSRQTAPLALVVMSSVGLSVARIVTRHGSFNMGGATYDETLSAHGIDPDATESVEIPGYAALVVEALLADPAFAEPPRFAFTPAQEKELRQRGFLPAPTRSAAPAMASDRWTVRAGDEGFTVSARVKGQRPHPTLLRSWNDVREAIMR